ncbi:putative alcohol dehydrogenase [Xylariaceae sp. FL1019]|nr:putative alcohol dehydrogenase [Xylariaceae sp. FL1019]
MSQTQTQKALLLREIGHPVVLTTTHPIPQPGENQVQVRVTVAGLNPHDEKTQAFNLFKDTLPAVLTHDVVGRVSALGPGITDLAVGDRVVYLPAFKSGGAQNGLQEYAIADRLALAKIPDSVSDDEAATLPVNIFAPLVALFQTLAIPAPWTEAASSFDYAGTTLLVVGGGSNCGRFGTQLASLAGIGRIVVVGGNEEELRSYGATHVLNRHGGHDVVLSRVRDIVGDDLLYAFDAITHDQILALNALSSTKRGALARLLPLAPVDDSKVVGKTAGYDVRDVFGSAHVYPEFSRAFWDRVMGWIGEGKIKPLNFVVKEGLSAEYVNEVLDAYRDGRAVVKTHIHL